MARRFLIDPGYRVVFAELGVDLRELIARADLSPRLFHREPLEVSATEYLALWEALTEMRNPVEVALVAAQLAASGRFSPLLFACACSPTYEFAVDRLRSYKSLLGPFTLRLDHGVETLTVTPEAAPELEQLPDDLAALEVAFQLALIRHSTRTNIDPAQVRMPPYLAREARFEAFFGNTIKVGSQVSISFTLDDARRPFLTYDSSMWNFFEPELQRRLSAADAENDIAAMTRAALIELLPAGESSIGAVAKRLALSQRTLQRRLIQEGTTFKAVLGSLRSQLAVEYIEKHVSTAEIAFLLAYGEVNSFTRAFRGWKGVTPDVYRNRTTH